MDWSDTNYMTCNPTKCKELVFSKRDIHQVLILFLIYIVQYDAIEILDVTFQTDSKFTKHVAHKLKEANKCLYVIRSLWKKGCTQKEIDHLFVALN